MTEAELARLSPEERDEFEERAAIREYDGGFTRRAAELLAYREIIGGRAKAEGPPRAYRTRDVKED